ncbi:MAG: hypothetical protein R3F61_35820 [Myxococcota bacterium]
MIPFAVVACFTGSQRSITSVPNDTDTDVADTGADCTQVDLLDVQELFALEGSVFAGLYTGTETRALYETGAGTAALCEAVWQVQGEPDPTLDPCEECEFTFRVQVGDPQLTSSPGFDCSAFEATVELVASDEGYGYGFGPYFYQGTRYEAMWFNDPDAATWAPAFLLDAGSTPIDLAVTTLLREYTIEVPSSTCP